MIDFFLERGTLDAKLKDLSDRLESFGTYVPQYKLSGGFSSTHSKEEIELTAKGIKEQFEKDIMANIQKVDSDFALKNYEYVLKKMQGNHLAQVYEKMGPLNFFVFDKYELPDFWLEQEKENELKKMMDERFMQKELKERKSGAIYRGEIFIATGKPDGRGFKVFNGQSLYEGWFDGGSCHGYGRAISSKGEIYQGFFENDSMTGKGFFIWPDGRMYEGDWDNNTKNGRGKYWWPNGQVYEGQFRKDQCDGEGTLYYPDGKRYIGLWKDGDKHGKGFIIFPDGSSYHQIFRHGKKVTTGILTNAANQKMTREDLK